jgi:hypothetical protein
MSGWAVRNARTCGGESRSPPIMSVRSPAKQPGSSSTSMLNSEAVSQAVFLPCSAIRPSKKRARQEGLVHQDRGPADEQRRPEFEAAGVPRQRGRLGHDRVRTEIGEGPRVDHAHRSAVRRDHALGPPGRARGEEDAARVPRPDIGPHQRPSLVREGALNLRGLERRGRPDRHSRAVRSRAVRHKDAGPQLLDLVPHPLVRPRGVDERVGRTQLQRGEGGGHHPDRARQPNRQESAGHEPERGQPHRVEVGELVKLPVRGPPRSVDQRRSLGRGRGPRPDAPVNRPERTARRTRVHPHRSCYRLIGDGTP